MLTRWLTVLFMGAILFGVALYFFAHMFDPKSQSCADCAVLCAPFDPGECTPEVDQRGVIKVRCTCYPRETITCSNR